MDRLSSGVQILAGSLPVVNRETDLIRELQSPALPPFPERYYEDRGWPHIPKQKSAAGRERQRKQYISALKRGTPSHVFIAAQLERCRRNHRCMSGACPECGWAAGRRFVEIGRWLAADSFKLTFTTLQFTDQSGLPRRLTDFDVAQQRFQLEHLLVNAQLDRAPFLCALDFSFDVFTALDSKRWSCHWTLFTTNRDEKLITQALRRFVDDTDMVPVPVLTRLVKRTPEKAFSYGYKTAFNVRRSPRTEDDENEKLIRPGSTLFYKIVPVLHTIGFAQRVLIRNMQRQFWPP